MEKRKRKRKYTSYVIQRPELERVGAEFLANLRTPEHSSTPYAFCCSNVLIRFICTNKCAANLVERVCSTHNRTGKWIP